MSIAEFAQSLNFDFINLFFVPFGTVLVSVACRYAERHEVFRSLTTNREEERETHFGALRVGPDLVLVAIVAAVGVCELAWKGTNDTKSSLALEAAGLVMFELCLLIWVVILHLLHRYPEFRKGMVLPNLVGSTAVYLSAEFFRFYIR